FWLFGTGPPVIAACVQVSVATLYVQSSPEGLPNPVCSHTIPRFVSNAIAGYFTAGGRADFDSVHVPDGVSYIHVSFCGVSIPPPILYPPNKTTLRLMVSYTMLCPARCPRLLQARPQAFTTQSVPTHFVMTLVHVFGVPAYTHVSLFPDPVCSAPYITIRSWNVSYVIAPS